MGDEAANPSDRPTTDLGGLTMEDYLVLRRRKGEGFEPLTPRLAATPDDDIPRDWMRLPLRVVSWIFTLDLLFRLLQLYVAGAFGPDEAQRTYAGLAITVASWAVYFLRRHLHERKWRVPAAMRPGSR